METNHRATSKRVHWSHADRRAVAICAGNLVNSVESGFSWNKPTIIEAQRLLFSPDHHRAESSITPSLVRELQNMATLIATEAPKQEKRLSISAVNELAKEWQKSAEEGKSTRNIKTVYYDHRMEAIHINSSKYSNSAVERAVGHMQVNHYGASICEVFDAMTGTLHAVLTNKTRGMEIVFKRDVVEGM